MEKAKRDLKSVSAIIIIIAIADLVSAIMSVASPSGSATYQHFINDSGFTADQATAAVATVISVAIILFLLELFVGLKGIIVANGGKKSKLATVVVVFSIICLVIEACNSIYLIVVGTTNILGSRIIVQVCALSLFIYYIVITNKVIAMRSQRI
jgi:hypothetical protein